MKKNAIYILLTAQLTACTMQTSLNQSRQAVASLQALRFRNVTKQTADWSCGPASLTTLLREGFDDSITEEQLIERIINTTEHQKINNDKGISLMQLADAAKALGYQAVAKDLTSRELELVNLPVIVRLMLLDGPHFVVMRGTYSTEKMTYALIVDPSSGHIRMPYHELVDKWLENKTRSPVLIITRSDGLWKENSSLFIEREPT
jgi:predicted double-glycine peptidase